MNNPTIPHEANLNPLDETVASMRVIDPPNTSLDLSARMLCQNVLATGMVGSGKTTSVIYPLLKEAIAYRAGEPDRKTGIFVFDSKCDGTTERVQTWAAQHGRADDLVVLRPGSEWGIDPLGTGHMLSRIETVAAKLTAGFEDMGKDNQYWQETMRRGITSALVLDMVEHGDLDLTRTLRAVREMLVGNSKEALQRFASLFERIAPHMEPNAASILDGHAKGLSNWVGLDSKTRGILQSCVANALDPLFSPAILDYYPVAGRRAFAPERVVTEGKILVLRISATNDTAVAKTLGRLIKADIYRAIQSRETQAGSTDRLVGLFFDEYPLVATSTEPHFGDVQNLQTMREKRGFVVAGTQGYVSMNEAIGRQRWEALRINFGNFFFFKSNEPEVEEHARTILGTKDASTSVKVNIESRDAAEGGIATASASHRKVSVEGEQYIIGRGDLARLVDQEVFYSLANGEKSESPVFIQPVHEEYRTPKAPETPNAVDVAGAIYRHWCRHQRKSNHPLDVTEFAAEPVLPSSLSKENPPELPWGGLGTVDLIALDRTSRVLLEEDRAATAKRRPTASGRQFLRSFAFMAASLFGPPLPQDRRIVLDVFRATQRAILNYAKTLRSHPAPVDLAAQTHDLYNTLCGEPYEVTHRFSAEMEAAGRDNLLLCRTVTDLDLSAMPVGMFGDGSVGFFTALAHPSCRPVLPRLVSVSAHDGVPLAVFDPAAITPDNAIAVAAALLSFAYSMVPSPSRGISSGDL